MVSFTPFSLSALDHSLVPTYILQFLGFHASNPELCLSHLQAGIDRLLEHLPFVGGEIVPSTEPDARPGQLIVRPGNALDIAPLLTVRRVPDVRLPPATAAATPTDHKTTPIASLDETFAPLPRTLPPTQPRPVARFQATIVADGVILSVMSSHLVFDGTGVSNMYELLADCCRGDIPRTNTRMDEEVALRRHITTSGIAGPPPTPDQLSEIGQSYLTADEEGKQDMSSFFSPDLLSRPFLFVPSKIARLREACIRALPEPTFLSDNDVLTGLLGTGITRARESAGVDSSFPSRSLMFALNLRKRLTSVPAHYLGNAVSVVRLYAPSSTKENDAGLESEDLLSEAGVNATRLREIADMALQSRRGIQTRSDAWLRSCISFLAARSNWGSPNLRFADVVLSSWRHLSVYRLDFGPGIGRIDSFEVRQGLVDGSCTIMPGMNDKVALWDVRISLRPASMQFLEQDPLVSWCLKE